MNQFPFTLLRKQKYSLKCLLLFLAVLSISFLCMPFIARIGQPILTALSGVLFWIGLIGTVFHTLRFVQAGGKLAEGISSCTRRYYPIISIFQNPKTRLLDSVAALSVILLVLGFLFDFHDGWKFLFLSIAIFFLYWHFVLNSKAYSIFEAAQAAVKKGRREGI